MNSAIFGKYYDTQSPIHSLDPRTKLVATLVMVVILFLATNWASMLFCTAAVALMFALAHIAPSHAIHSILPLSFVIIISALFNLFFVQGGSILVDWSWLKISEDGVTSALFLALRLTLLLMLGSLLTMTTTSFDITEGMKELLSPLRRIGIPIDEFAFVMGTALGFVPLIANEFSSIRKAQLSRGADLKSSPRRGMSSIVSIIIPMFAGIFRHADKITEAMEARCFQGLAKRTLLQPLAFHPRDAIAFASIAAIAACVVLISLV